MKALIFLLQKEFRQIFRDPVILRLIIVMPMVQLILIPFAADYEVKNITIVIEDQDQSTYSRRLIEKFQASNYFDLLAVSQDHASLMSTIDNGDAAMILTIPFGFEKGLILKDSQKIFIGADAVDGVKAGFGMSYASQIAQHFAREIRHHFIPVVPVGAIPQIVVRSSVWYNPLSNYHWFMVPGILAILVTMVGSFLSALNIVAEKEGGTIEQLNVTPVRKSHFILGKLIPFWILGLVTVLLGMLVGWVVYGLWPIGSFLSVIFYAGAYLLAVLGVGLLISTFAETQQQATLIAFFIMMIFILMSGLYTPIDSMPQWAQKVAHLNPPTYFVHGIRSIYLMGSTLWDLKEDIMITLCFAVIFNLMSVLNYRKYVR